jgi:hypothetical protein
MKASPNHIVRNSAIHGRGVFARKPIRKGARVIEYTGPIISNKEAEKIGTQTVHGHSHTMLFQLDKKRVINGIEGGDAKYLNHGCDPNCETEQDGDHIYIKAIRNIKEGEELVYDYHLQVPGKITEEIKKEFVCLCGSPKCRGTQIDGDLLKKQAKKDKKKAEKKAKDKAKSEAKDKKKKAKADLKNKKKDKAKDKKESKDKKKDKKKKK